LSLHFFHLLTSSQVYISVEYNRKYILGTLPAIFPDKQLFSIYDFKFRFFNF
jgi:hypothetical protein